ncbi:MAG: hypothetical protein N2517_09305 [Ignavibacteria bacterium]|nr:hypothetical protein [Ignavibacteria bacterium]
MKEEIYFLDRILLYANQQEKRWKYEPLKIVFYLGAPIALSHPWLHFDGIISHLSLRRLLKEDYYLLPAKFPMSRLTKDIKLPNLPIRFAGAIPQASISFFPHQRKAMEVIYKKLEDRWLGQIKKIYHGSGYFKDYAIKHIYFSATSVEFYVVGDYEGLQDIMSDLIALGDNTRLGWGKIREYHIERIPEDYSIIKDGIAQRPIPVKYCEYYEDAYYLSWRPPYWSADMIELCVPPGSKVRLSSSTIEKMRYE